MKAVRLRTEYLYNPICLDIKRPRFSWNLEGGISQTAFRILAADAENGSVLWDSGRVESASMTNVPYGGVALRSRERVLWQVKVWDENDSASDFSEPAGFEMGLLSAGDWKARWITGNYVPRKGVRYPVDYFRKKFRLKRKVKKARLYASARGLYRFKIDGRKTDDMILAPGMTDYRRRIPYQVYDVTNLFSEENVHTLELALADGWYRGSTAAYGVTNVYGNETAVIAQLELTYDNGETEVTGTDESFSWCNDGPVRFADLKDGEVYDSRRMPGFSGKAKCSRDQDTGKLCASDNVPVKEHETFTPVLLQEKNGSAVFDFRQNIAGYLDIKVQGKRGEKITIICGEILDENGNVDLSPVQETIPAKGLNTFSTIAKLLGRPVKGKTRQTPEQKIVIRCSGEEIHYHTDFAVFGFQYAQVIFEAGSKIKMTPEDITAVAVYSDMERTGTFECSNPLVNKLHENTLWSMKSNFLDVPTDCPTRERLGWTGDAQIFFKTGAYLMDTAAFFRKWMLDISDAQYPNGMIPAVVPYQGVEMMYRPTGTSVGWADAIYLIPYRYYLMYRDSSLLKAYWPNMKRYADAVIKNIGPKNKKWIKENPDLSCIYEKGVHLGEWLEPEEFRETVYGTRASHPEECTAYFYLTMRTMARIARIIDKPDEAPEYDRQAVKAKRAYSAYIHTKASLDTDRQAKLVRPLAVGILNGKDKAYAQKRLVQAVRNFSYRVGTGFLSTPFLLPELTEAGEAETAYKVLENTQKPGWLYEVEQGATTVWESWEGKASRNHYSPGAVCQWLYETVLGIRLVGDRKFLIGPVPGGSLTYAKGEWKSVYGTVKAAWQKTKDGLKFEFEIPVNTSAEVKLPDGRTKHLTAGKYSF
ncbi:MAG: family 78 glycoside hydrolase catalytic domain [Lachnospiraceae bacterium]|jgi:alpha-L-rhamnosidase